MTLVRLGRIGEAANLLEESEETVRTGSGDPEIAALVIETRTQMLRHEGKLEEALAAMKRAGDLLIPSLRKRPELTARLGELLYFQSEIFEEQGDVEAASVLVGKALLISVSQESRCRQLFSDAFRLSMLLAEKVEPDGHPKKLLKLYEKMLEGADT